MVVLKWIGIGLGVLVALAAIVIVVQLYSASKRQPSTAEVSLGVEGGTLTTCPDSPNCVSTQADPNDETHYLEPIQYEGTPQEVKERLMQWIRSQPRAELVTDNERYLRAVFSSRIFGFRDDLEVYFPHDESVAHLRSASRVGEGDMGVNRERAEAVRRVLQGQEE